MEMENHQEYLLLVLQIEVRANYREIVFIP